MRGYGLSFLNNYKRCQDCEKFSGRFDRCFACHQKYIKRDKRLTQAWLVFADDIDNIKSIYRHEFKQCKEQIESQKKGFKSY